MIWHVYRVTNIETGQRYVGITAKTIAVRWHQHKLNGYAGRGGYLARAIRTYKHTSFYWEPIYEAVDEREAKIVERGLIAQWGTYAPRGYNLTSGGEKTAGYHLAPEVREKQRQGRLGKTHTDVAKAKMRAARLGKPLSDEVRANMSANHRPTWSPAQRAAIGAALRTAEHREKLRALALERYRITPARKRTEAERATLSARNKAQFADPEKRARHLAACLAAIQRRKLAVKG